MFNTYIYLAFSVRRAGLSRKSILFRRTRRGDWLRICTEVRGRIEVTDHLQKKEGVCVA
jgi:hypothetical protein